VQWAWRLLFSGLLCVPALFMLVAGAWNDRAITSPEPPDSSGLYARSSADLTISLPRAELAAEPAVTATENQEPAPNAPVASPPPPAPQRSRAPHARLELWYAAAPRQEAPASAHWTLTRRPGIWVPGANQDGGG
jgi:hypothetical protein